MATSARRKLEVRPFVTTGVALAAASTIALTPMAPPTAAIHVPRVASEAMQLMAYPVDPLKAYTDLINHTVSSLQTLANLALVRGPAPILQQLIANQLDYAQVLGAGFVTAGGVLITQLTTTVPTLLQKALNSLLAGNVLDATEAVVVALLAPLGALTPIVFGVEHVLTMMATHAQNLATQIPGIASDAINGIVGPLGAFVVSTAAATHNVLDALGHGDPVGVLDALIAAPAVVADGTLNGLFTAGLIGVGGPIWAILQIRNNIAQAIDPPPPSGPATPLKAPATTVTLGVATTPVGVNASGTKLITTGTSRAGAGRTG